MTYEPEISEPDPEGIADRQIERDRRKYDLEALGRKHREVFDAHMFNKRFDEIFNDDTAEF